MKRSISFFTLFFFLNFFLFSSFGSIQIYAAANHLLINEVEYDTVQSGTDTAYEWLELYNPTATNIDISGWTLNDNQFTYTFPSGTKVYAGQHLLIANNTGFSTNYPSITPNITISPSTQLPLSNISDRVQLKNGSGATIDEMAWGGGITGWTQTVSAAGRSLCRIDYTDSNDNQSDWQTCNTPTPIAGPIPNTPTDITLSANTQNENTTISTIIGGFSSTDGDVGDSHTYSLSCSIPGVDDAFFSIAGVNLINTSIFDYENPLDTGANNIYNICIRSTDSYGLYFDKNFTISVNDVDEIAPHISIIDNVAVGPVQVDTVVANITDTNISLREYSLSADVICDSNDFPGITYTNGSTLTFNTEANNGKYICFKGEDSAGNISYTGSTNSLNIDIVNPSISITDNVAVGPVQIDTVQATISDLNNDENFYSFSSDIICDGDDFPGTSYTGALLTFDDENYNGEYICFKAQDTAGNISYSGTISPLNIDATLPVITRLGNAIETVQVGSSYTDAGATASDNYDGDITGDITINNPVNTTIVGSYNVTYDVSDIAGNNAVQVTRTVNVVDTEMPVINLLGTTPVDIEVGTLYTDAGATASDNYDGDITGDIVVSGDTVETDTIGSYTIRYDVQDSEGNDAIQVQRVVNIVDTAVPVITLVGITPLDVELGSTYTDGGATASDNYDGDITGDIVVGGDTIDTNYIGDYIITYNVEDSSGNDASQVSRTVRVRDTQAPLFQVNDDVNIDKNNSDTINISITDIALDTTSIEYGFSVDDTCDIHDTFGNVFSADTDFVFTHELHNGEYLCIKAADVSGNTAYFISNEAFNIDSIAPTLLELTPISTPTNDITLSYTFSSDEEGTIIYTGDCVSSSTGATIGNNTITFSNLSNGTYANCGIKVMDHVGNISEILYISAFTVNISSSSSGGGGGGASSINHLLFLNKEDLKTTSFSHDLSFSIVPLFEDTSITDSTSLGENVVNEMNSYRDYPQDGNSFSGILNIKESPFQDIQDCNTISKILSSSLDIDSETALEKQFIDAGVLNTNLQSFEGNRYITRIEVLKILFRTYCIDYASLEGISPFKDIQDNTWQAKITQKGKELQIIHGQQVSNEFFIFRPNDNSSVAESLKMLLRVIGYTGTKTGDWEVNYLDSAHQMGLIDTTNGNNGILRVNFLKLLYNALTQH